MNRLSDIIDIDAKIEEATQKKRVKDITTRLIEEYTRRGKLSAGKYLYDLQLDEETTQQVAAELSKRLLEMGLADG